MSQRGKWTVVGGELLGHLSDLLVVLQVVTHELEERLLLGIKLNLSLQVITVLLQFLTTVLVNFDLVLKGGDDDLGVFLEILQLSKDLRMSLF